MGSMAGERGSWSLLGLLGLAALAQPLGCVGPAGEDTVDPDSAVSQYLAAVGPVVVVPALTAFRADLVVLEAELDLLAEAEQPDRSAAQEAWRAAMASWQRLELMQLGPADSSLSGVGGLDLRDVIYSWPTTSPCRVDQETVAGGWASSSYFDDVLVNAVGLDALEYLLFDPNTEHDCPSQLELDWGSLADVGKARAQHAAALTGELVVVTDEIRAAWDDFGPSLAAGAEPFSSQLEALNAVYDALYRVETSTKDRRLLAPLGLRDCSTGSCVGDFEHLYAGFSHRAIVANLEGFGLLAGAGLDDLLVEAGHGDVADALASRLSEAEAASAAVVAPLDAAAAGEVDALVAAVTALADLLKGDVATVLYLQLPTESLSDVD